MWANLKNLRVNYGVEVRFRLLVAAFPSWSSGFSIRPAHVIFSVDQVALGKWLSISSSLRFSTVNFIPLVFHTLLRLHATVIRRASELKLGAFLQNISFAGK